jgi:hypothetical protein
MPVPRIPHHRRQPTPPLRQPRLAIAQHPTPQATAIPRPSWATQTYPARPTPHLTHATRRPAARSAPDHTTGDSPALAPRAEPEHRYQRPARPAHTTGDSRALPSPPTPSPRHPSPRKPPPAPFRTKPTPALPPRCTPQATTNPTQRIPASSFPVRALPMPLNPAHPKPARPYPAQPKALQPAPQATAMPHPALPSLTCPDLPSPSQRGPGLAPATHTTGDVCPAAANHAPPRPALARRCTPHHELTKC